MPTSVIVTGANGRMGTTIAELAKADADLELLAVIERPGFEQDLDRFGVEVFTDVKKALQNNSGAIVVDFTSPDASMELVQNCDTFSCGAVLGTTGFSASQVKELKKVAASTSLFWAPNMSVGINTLLKILPELTQLLGEKYDVEISETHHKHKKDAPSGTALKLAEVLAEAKNMNMDEHGKFCRHGMIGERKQDELGVQTLRGGDVVGDHTVFYFGPGERIEVTHRAHSRETFAQGALRAAKWLSSQQPGRLYSMSDLLT